MGFAARVRVYPRDDDGTGQHTDAGAFESSNTGIFRVISTVLQDDSINPYWEVLLAAVSVGTATLLEYVDAENHSGNESVVPVTESLTVVVHNIATEIVSYYTEEGGGSELLVPDIGGGTFKIRIPLNKNATFRVEGRTGKAIVPLSNVTFSDGGSTHFHVVATSDPNTVTIVSDAQFGGEPLTITADGDPSPNAASLSLEVIVEVTGNIATNLVEFYSLEPRG